MRIIQLLPNVLILCLLECLPTGSIFTLLPENNIYPYNTIPFRTQLVNAYTNLSESIVAGIMPLKKLTLSMNKLTLAALIALAFNSCLRPTPLYYTSPLDINVNHYRPVPMVADSLKSALYANIAFAGGIANRRADNLFSFQGSIHRSHQFGNFQAFYGADFLFGTYHVNENRLYIYPGNTASNFHIPESRENFGAYGLNAAINYVHAFRVGELRIGVESSFQQEFGPYLAFRKSLPDSAISILSTYAATKTIGGFSEILFRRSRTGTSFGLKISSGGVIFNRANYTGDEKGHLPFYISGAAHITKNKLTAFWQLNAGVYTNTFMTGLSYKLSGKKPKK